MHGKADLETSPFFDQVDFYGAIVEVDQVFD
jgi:hypothetical protein